MNTRGVFLAELRLAEPWPGAPSPEVIADALLPVVERIAAQRAAEELRTAADSTKSWPRSVMSDSVGAKLRARAAALGEEASR